MLFFSQTHIDIQCVRDTYPSVAIWCKSYLKHCQTGTVEEWHEIHHALIVF